MDALFVEVAKFAESLALIDGSGIAFWTLLVPYHALMT